MLSQAEKAPKVEPANVPQNMQESLALKAWGAKPMGKGSRNTAASASVSRLNLFVLTLTSVSTVGNYLLQFLGNMGDDPYIPARERGVDLGSRTPSAPRTHLFKISLVITKSFDVTSDLLKRTHTIYTKVLSNLLGQEYLNFVIPTIYFVIPNPRCCSRTGPIGDPEK